MNPMNASEGMALFSEEKKKKHERYRHCSANRMKSMKIREGRGLRGGQRAEDREENEEIFNSSSVYST